MAQPDRIGKRKASRQAQNGSAGLRWISMALHFTPLLLLVVSPLLAFLIQSFWYVESGQIVREFTVRNYVRFFVDPTFLPIFLKTCLLGLEVMMITLAIGFPIAFLIWTLGERSKYLWLTLFVIPLLMSYIIKIYAIRGMLGRSGLLNQLLVFAGILDEPSSVLLFNMTAVLITLSVILTPFAILPIFISLERIPRDLIESSSDLGAGAWSSFRWIIFPLALPGTMVGASFSFVLAVSDFVTPEMVGGTSGFTFGRLIFSQFGMAFNWPFGAALSVLLLLLVALVMTLAGWAGRPKGLER